MPTSSSTRPVLPEGAPGRTREESTPVLPGEQASFAFWDTAATQESIARGYEVVRNAASIESRKRIALAVGKNLDYANKVSEGMNRAGGVHIQWDWVVALLRNNPDAAALIVEFVTTTAGYEMPERRVRLTDHQKLGALLRELGESGKVGDDVIDRAAKRIGTDKGAFRR